MTDTLHRYAVTYRTAPQSAVSFTSVWLLIEDVPADVDQDGVTAALQGWSRWAEWSRRVAIGGTVNVVRIKRAGQVLPEPTTETVHWPEIVPPLRSLTTPIPGALYGALSVEARRRGITLREFGAEVVTAGWHALQATESNDTTGAQL